MMTRNQLMVLLMLISIGSFCQSIPADSAYPPAGHLVDIGGRRLHNLCSGKGSPTIILIAGGGAFSIDWDLVQGKMAGMTRVCAYDRAGLGWSDPGPAEETVEETIEDLHGLLKASKEKGPYLLVGASVAGIFIQAYQHAYSEEVAGLIFTNSSNRIGFATKNKTDLIWNLTEDEIKSAFPFPHEEKKARTIPTKAPEPFDQLPPKQQAIRIWLTVRLEERWDTARSGPESLLSWRKEFLREFSQTDAGNKPPLGSLPVIVLSSEPAATDSMRRSREGAAARLDFLSSNSLHLTAAGSGHEIHLYQPDRVVEALHLAVLAVRKGIPLNKVSGQEVGQVEK